MTEDDERRLATLKAGRYAYAEMMKSSHAELNIEFLVRLLDEANAKLARLREPDEAMVRDAVDAMKYEMTLVAMARAALRAAAAELELESKP